MSEQVTLRFDPLRPQVTNIIAEATEGQDPDKGEQCIADAIMAACILGEIFEVEDEIQYLRMIRAAMPNAKRAAGAFAEVTT